MAQEFEVLGERHPEKLSAAWCRLARRFSHRFQRPIRPTFSVLPDYPQGPMISPARALPGPESRAVSHRRFRSA